MNQIKIFGRALILSVLVWSGLAYGSEIHDAARRGDTEKVESLIRENAATVKDKDEKGATPLHRAANNGHDATVELLLAHQADVNARDKYSQTPLHLAALQGRTNTVGLLLANKAEVNARKSNGSTLEVGERTGKVDHPVFVSR